MASTFTKSHKRVQGEFGRFIKDDPRFDAELRAFLGRAHNLKAIADYETGAGSRVSVESASAAIRTARRFVECVVDVLPTNGKHDFAGNATTLLLLTVVGFH